MFGSKYVPYELLGFLVFWSIVVVLVAVSSIYLYFKWIQLIEYVRDEFFWSDANPHRQEKPDGWKLVGAFAIHILWSVSKFKSPICWRWKTYKENYVND